jgi:flavin-binding protein dodecin
MPEQSEGTTEGTTEVAPTGAGGTTEQAKSLEDLLAGLDDTARAAVLGEVHKARTEAANYRGKLRAAEPKAAEYDRLAEASKTADERAQEAVKAADTRALASMQRVARAEVKAALTGLVDDPNSIVEDLNLARFIDDDGEINDGAIAALKTKYAGFAGKRGPRPDLSQGSGANGKTAANPAAEFASILQSQLGSRG